MPENQIAPAPMEEETDALARSNSQMEADDDCDPYLKITIPSLRQSRETKHKTHDRNPDWNETLTFHGVTGRTELLDIAVMVCARARDVSPLFFCVAPSTGALLRRLLTAASVVPLLATQDHDVMSKDDKLGRQTFRASDLTTGVKWEGWLELEDVTSGRIQLEILLEMDGTLAVKCICARDLPVQTRWQAKAREFRATGLNIRDAWEMDGEGGIPDQTTLPLHPEMPVCARLVTDGYCMFGEKCQFHHPEQIKRKPRPPPKDRRLEIKQGIWGYLRDGDLAEGSQIDVTDMLKDIVIEQLGIQLELPKTMKHLLWRKGVRQPGSGEEGDNAGEKNGSDDEEEEEEEEEPGDGDDDDEDEEDGGDEDDPDAPVQGIGAKILERLTFWKEPVYGLKVWYYIKGDRLQIKTWRAEEWIYIESFQEQRKRRRKQLVKRFMCFLFLLGCLFLGYWLYFIMAGMSCSSAEYSECFDKNDVYTTPCEMNFEFPTHEITHINVTNVRGNINITSSASTPNITVTIRQTVLEEGAMAGLTSNAELTNGVLNIYSRWNNSHESEFPDMYGGSVSIFNCPSAEIIISLPATVDTTNYGSLFSPSVTAMMDEPVYECSYMKNPQACWFGFLFLTSIELQSTIEFLMAGNDTLPWPAGTGSATSAFSSTVSRVTRSYDDYALFPGRVVAYNETIFKVAEGDIVAKNVKANAIEIHAGSGTANLENSKAHLTKVHADKDGVVTLAGSAMPRDYGRGGVGWNSFKLNGLLSLIGGGAFTVGDVIGGDMKATNAESVEASLTLNAFQGVVKGVDAGAVTTPSTCYGAACKHANVDGGTYVGSRENCDGSDDWDCTYQEIDISATTSSVAATCKAGAADGC
jgi:hypothetical protein